jgi:gliding motility-associated-like protein
LGQSYNQIKCGLNFVQASQKLGKRGSIGGVNQPATFAISGIPVCAVIEKAFVWSSMSGSSFAHNISVTNPAGSNASFPMAVIGTGPDKCWSYGGTTTYRADVTSIISGNGNYQISGFPTNPPNSNQDTDGATLMIIYSNPAAAYRGHIIIHDGCVVINGGSTTQTITGINACANSTFAVAFSMIGDLQMAPTSHTMNGTNAPITWNWWNYTQVNTTVTNGQASSNFAMNSSGDCYNFAVAGLYYQTTTCVTCSSPALTVTPSSTQATCSQCNGSATVSVTGGSPPYTYSWAPSGGTNATASNLCPGTYTVSINDATGCNPATQTITVTSSATSITVTGTPTAPSCNGGCNGSIATTITGGVGPYTFAWTPSGSGQNPTNLCAGSYTVTVTDANNCTGTATITVTQPTALTATTTQVNTSCNAQCNGSATVAPSGGTPPYSYSWSPTPGTGATITGLCAANYTCSITDANGCNITRTFTITQPTPVTLTTSSTQATCGSSNGSATVSASGGTPNYNYSWNTSPVQLTATASNIPAGNYIVTVTDNNACTSTATVSVTSSAAPTATITASTNVSCNPMCNGSASVGGTGGTPPYSYAWAPSGGTGPAATGLCAGTYTATLTDAAGCITTASVTITQPPLLTAATTQVNVSCNGGSNGSAVATGAGGTPPYDYVWSTGASNDTVTGLAAGTYTVTVTDGSCSASGPQMVTNGDFSGGNTGFSSSYVYCNTPNCITSEGMYSVGNNPTYFHTAFFGSDHTTGSGDMMIVNGSGTPGTSVWCQTVNVTPNTVYQFSTWVSTMNASSPAQLQFSINNVPIGTTFSAPANTYTWTQFFSTWNSGSNTTATICILNQNTSLGGNDFGLDDISFMACTPCTTTATVTITEPTALTLSVAGFDATCNGVCDGQTVVIPAGGTSPYSYSWSPGGCTGASCNNLCAGTYSVTVTDAQGCTATDSAIVNEPTPVTLALSSTAAICGQSNGSASVVASGGTPTYTYAWNTSPVQSTSTANNLSTGMYAVTVMDFNNCQETDSVFVNDLPSVTASIASSVNTTCFNACDGTATATQNGGTAPYGYSWSTSPVQTTATATGLCAGTYTVTITDMNGCSDTAIVIITQPTQVIVTPNPVATICIGQTATLSATASGGNGPYTYTWCGGVTGNPVSMSPTLTTPCDVMATDVNGCTSTLQTFTITVNPPLSATATGTGDICPGANLQLNATGGGGDGVPYSYSWSPAAGLSNPNIANPTASPSVTTIYTVTVTDNCTTLPATATVTVTVNPIPVPGITSDNVAGCMVNPIGFCVNFTDQSTIASGSVVGWAWTLGNNTTSSQQNPSNICYTTAGSYSVYLTVTSDSGCVASTTVPYVITVYPDPVADFTFGPQPATIVNPEICFTDSSIGAVSWAWDFGDPTDNTTSTLQNPCHVYSDTGNFCVQLAVVSVNGCVDSVTWCLVIQPDFTIYVPNAFTPNFDGVNDLFFPKGIGIDDDNFRMMIFDRWGNLIYITEDPNDGWDGRVKKQGEIVQQDVYVWKIEVTDIMDAKHIYMGHVSVIK